MDPHTFLGTWSDWNCRPLCIHDTCKGCPYLTPIHAYRYETGPPVVVYVSKYCLEHNQRLVIQAFGGPNPRLGIM